VQTPAKHSAGWKLENFSLFDQVKLLQTTVRASGPRAQKRENRYRVPKMPKAPCGTVCPESAKAFGIAELEQVLWIVAAL